MLDDLRRGFGGFAEQLVAQVEAAGYPAHENAIHHCLALGFQNVFELEPGDIVFERPLGSGNCDLWFRPWDLALEVKYFRPIPSGATRPMPQYFGTLLADFNKLMHMLSAQKVVSLVTDRHANEYLARNTKGLLPMTIGATTRVGQEDLARLSTTASTAAFSCSDLALHTQ